MNIIKFLGSIEMIILKLIMTTIFFIIAIIRVPKEVNQKWKDFEEKQELKWWIGNVLSYYYNFEHDVIDKYEVSNGVINEDISTYKTDKKYDAIISISTFEHIGEDEKDIGNQRMIKAFDKVKSLLKPHGIFLVTFPFWGNRYLEEYVTKNNFDIVKYTHNNIHGMKRELYVAVLDKNYSQKTSKSSEDNK